MRSFFPFTTACLLLFTTITLRAQSDDFAYAITDYSKEGTSWNVLRKIDLNTGKYSSVLLDGANVRALTLQPKSKSLKSAPAPATLPETAFNTGVAALALDKANNRLYFSPMFVSQLRYIDLSSMKVYAVGGQLTTTEKKQPDPGKTFSRMAITSDGAGYAISNDAHHFIEFSTSRQPQITEHGKLVDDPANKNVSIQNSCTSYGGDVVADDNGKLLLISGRNYVFSIDPTTRVATHLALIKGLPPQFTTSAAVVHTDGQLLLSSASGNLGNFLVNPKSWTAVPFTSPGGSFNTSDLANSNVIVTKQKAPIAKREKIRSIINNFSGHLSLYPNPIMSDAGFTIHFNDVKDGAYIVQLIDLGGRPVYSRKINLTQKNTVQNFPVTLTTAKGLYLVRVMDAAKRSVFEHKVMVQ